MNISKNVTKIFLVVFVLGQVNSVCYGGFFSFWDNDCTRMERLTELVSEAENGSAWRSAPNSEGCQKLVEKAEGIVEKMDCMCHKRKGQRLVEKIKSIKEQRLSEERYRGQKLIEDAKGFIVGACGLLVAGFYLFGR